ncbi:MULTISPECIES: transcriptional regulator FtsR [Streptomyces]|uniref:MerR family transcriptional regulator n=2 Tax=Streptomyces TaxID=1883 RepID=A0A3R7FQX4_9ACTN|nr:MULTISPECIES: MerR family transcriptional regulator [Streptomyces]KNE79834.1 MerR family transcriptional regulator [Streptomyces fradiae]OFA47809.1 MerR family transcriptional regulator [Streptomyces fradiae]PQM21159.1 MerR family transcriptional regulator [Streptomyces xinghaiensis]RKM93525.1 MerR family transcriptional regulator [Streptomyces xinghaiensis]RNC71673.1 MerR family transcriptional regulator [Streptomyces xinghaiensis]
MRQTPSGGAGSGAAPDSRLLSIGRVLGLLRDEFPEITISKIRFLEAEGLVEPRRTPSGYRKFSPDDVERLARVLRMQRDHYLPLKVIREQLDALERGERPDVPAPGRARDLLDGVLDPGDADPAPARTDRAGLLAGAGVEERDLAEWESYGLISPLEDGSYGPDAVTIAGILGEIGRFGLEPRHLRVMKAAADREAGLVEQVVSPLRRHRNPQTRAHAESTARELATLSLRLHAALVQSSLGVRLR